MADSFLQPDEEKTEVLVCTPDKFVPKVMASPAALDTFTKSSIGNLGGTFHSGCSH